MLKGHERKEIGLGNTYQMYVYYNHHHCRQLKCVEVAGWHAYLVYRTIFMDSLVIFFFNCLYFQEFTPQTLFWKLKGYMSWSLACSSFMFLVITIVHIQLG
jgi:hypothetical protein